MSLWAIKSAKYSLGCTVLIRVRCCCCSVFISQQCIPRITSAKTVEPSDYDRKGQRDGSSVASVYVCSLVADILLGCESYSKEIRWIMIRRFSGRPVE